jgi:hypothetical protein
LDARRVARVKPVLRVASTGGIIPASVGSSDGPRVMMCSAILRSSAASTDARPPFT